MLKIKDMNLNNVIRQGDSQPREYQLDTGNLDLNLTNKSATIRLMTADFQGIGYETTATISSENKISFSIDDVIPARQYRLEVTVDDYVFPSRATDGQFNIDPSSHGQEVNIIQIIGKDEIVREVKEQIDSELEPFLGEIEQAELDREATNKSAKDYLSEFPTVKSKSEEAITKANQADNLSKSVQSQFNQVVIDGDSSVEAAQARVDASGHTNATLKERLDKEHNEVTAQLAQKVGGLEPKGLVGVSFDTQAPRIMDVIDDYIYGYSGTSLYRRSVDGGSWAAFLNNVPGALRILKTDDGEMLVMSSFAIFKSSGWGSQNVTWEEKVAANGDTVFLRWGIDGDGKKFIATTYQTGDFPQSRYVWASLDSGDTWKVVYDSVDIHGSDVANKSHMHAVAYDKWTDRFYLSEGHGVIAGIYVSEDDGQTWKRPEGMILNPGPTTITPTPEGLVCGTDSVPNGLYGVVSNKDAMKEKLVRTWTWHTGRDGLIGFAQRGYYDKFSGMVYVAFRSNYQDVKPVIVAGTPTSGGLVYTWDSGGVGQDDRIDNVVIPNENELLANAVAGSYSALISGKVVPPGVDTSNESVISGRSDNETSVAIGWGSKTNGAQSLAIGVGSSANGTQNSMAIGYNSKAGNNALSIGINSQSEGTGISIGEDSRSSGGSGVAVGYLATSEYEGVSVGRNAKASVYGIAIGVNAEAIDNGSNAVAIGKDSKAHGGSVALGVETQTTTNWQVAVGKRHLEFEPVSAGYPGAYTHEKVRLFTRKNSEDKLELCAQFPGLDTYANTTVIATQGVR